jgi:hypothetical protein
MKEISTLTSVGIDTIYPRLLDHLVASCASYDVNIQSWKTLPPNARTHSESPYGFKVYAIREAIASGYQIIVWADSAVFLVADPTPFFELVVEKGIVVLGQGDRLDKWVNDKSIKEFGAVREKLKDYWLLSGTVFGFDVRNPAALSFLDELERYEKGDWYCEDGQENDSVYKQHRHDEAIMSLLVYRHGIEVQNAYDYMNGGTDGVVFRTSKELR